MKVKIIITLQFDLKIQHHYYNMMIKPKQPLSNKIKSSIVRKPSLPIRRASSVQSNVSDQSCMSDRIIYKKPIPYESSNRPTDAADSKNYLSNTFEQQKSSFINASQKSLKKIKNKLSTGNQIVKKNEHSLTAFQWLIVMRHSYHIENKKRLSNSIKIKLLINYIRNRMYPDSLWNRILMMENQCKLTTSEIIATIEKETKSRLTLDDILLCISKNLMQNNSGNGEDHQSAAETARFTQNMKNNSQMKINKDNDKNTSQPKFIYKKTEQKSRKSISKVSVPEVKVKQIEPMSTSDMNQFKIDPQLNISPISINDQTNNVSFSMEESEQPTQFITQQNSILDKQDRFQSAFNGIQALKQNLQNSSNALEKITLANFLQEILAYSIYKNKQVKFDMQMSLNQSKKGLSQMDNFSQRKQSIVSTNPNQYFYGLKLQNRKSMEKIPIQVLQKLFGSRQFTQYFHNLQAIKISQYYNQLGLAISVLGTNLRILNLSNNNIKSIGFLKQMNTSWLQFVNLNSNKITNVSELLAFQRLEQIHAKNNCIDHVSTDKVNCRGLRIMDLGFNQINKQQDLWSLASLANLFMLNLVGNPIMVDYRSIGLLAKGIVVQHSDMYLFSSYTQYKDIAFEARQKEIREPNRDAPMQISHVPAQKGSKK